jgi:hypothetical protein
VKFFYDTEFHDNRKFIDLISIGVVCYETGREFYAVSSEFDTLAVAQEPWLMENVMSSIRHADFVDFMPVSGDVIKNFTVTDPHAMTRQEIRDGLEDFVHAQYVLANRSVLIDQIEFWHWYGAYDWVALSQLFGKMIEMPPAWPNLGFDIKQLHRQAKYCGLPAQPDGHHNALADARFNVVRYDAIMERLAA